MPLLEITSKDWFINTKALPDKESEEYAPFWQYQEGLCINGCTIEGVVIPGELYWHLNFWKTRVDYQVEIGGVLRTRDKLINPLLRDNEFIIFSEIRRAHIEQKGLMIFGARRLSKTTSLSSYLCHGATFDEGSQNVLAGTNSKDIRLLTKMMDVGLNNLPEYFTWMKIEGDWKTQVTLGAKTTANKNIPFSDIIIRNLSDGNNEEAIAGTKPRRLVIDEAGKNDWLDSYMAAAPGFTTRLGTLACSPIISGTSGDMEKYHDAKKVFFSCEAYNFLAYDDIKIKGRTHGLFLGAKYRQDGKVESTLGDYLKAAEGSDLYNFPMEVADEAKAFKITEDKIEELRKAGDKKKYLKEKMYFPKDVDDVFLNTNANMFNIDMCKAQQNRIETESLKGFPVELYYDGHVIKHRPSDKEFITEYPLRKQDPDAPIMIWEHPILDPPKFLYIAGIDSYRHDQAKYSDSLGSVYIYKRMHSLMNDSFQDMFVASYTARPESGEQWNEIVRTLLKYYNAYALVENDELGFINYMKSKNEAEIYLSPPPKIQSSQLIGQTSTKRDFGLSTAAPKIRNFMNGLWKQYLEENIDVELDENGNIVKELKGVRRVFDHTVLEETANYFDGANVDRLTAATLALVLASDLDPILGSAAKDKSESRFTKMFGAKKPKDKLFNNSGSMFSGRNRSMFKR